MTKCAIFTRFFMTSFENSLFAKAICFPKISTKKGRFLLTQTTNTKKIEKQLISPPKKTLLTFQKFSQYRKNLSYFEIIRKILLL